MSEKSAYDSLTPKQEVFCLAYIEGGNSSDAYRKAYNAGKMTAKTINEKASRLLAEGKVRARVEELRKPVVEAAQITLAGHLERLEALSVAAEQAGQYSAAITAEVSRGKASGLYVDKLTVGGDDKNPLKHSITVEFVKPRDRQVP